MNRTVRILSRAAVGVALMGGCSAEVIEPVGEAQQAASTVGSGSVTATLTTTSSWNGGYCDSITIKNSGAPVTTWTLKMATNGSTISNLWSASQSISGTTVTVTPADFNRSIPTGGSIEFGFCGTGSGLLTLTSVAVSGGSTGTGGASATGGASSTGGTTARGGASATGGTTARGGASATGGTTARGGATATGGTPATGGSGTTPKKFVGNITTGNSVDVNGMKYSKYWDQITPENAGKWGSVQSTPTSAFNWATLDAVYAYAQTNGIAFKQHTFVWGAQQPSGTPTAAQVETWIRSFCSRYPNTKLIDVVNEPPPHTTPTYTANLGAGETGSWPWIVKAFKLARMYCPNAVLIMNDYNNVEYASQEQHFIDIVNDIRSNGAPIDAVGCQAHGLKGVSAATLQTNINTMASKTNLPIYVTEYDIGGDDTTQATNFRNHIPVFWNTTAVKGITVWGWINGRTWITDSGLVNNTTPRPAMTWLMQYIGRPVPPN